MIEKLPPEFVAFFIAVFIAIARVLGDEKGSKARRICVESVICGCLSLSAHYAIMAMGLSLSWSVFIGGAIGYLGSAFVHEVAVKVIKKKTDLL